MVQTAVRLPRGLRDRLAKVGGERGLGEEIRRRLEISFNVEKASADPRTRELLDAISFFAEKATDYYGDWSKDAFAFEVLKACVDLLLKHFQPKGELIPHPTREGTSFLLFAPEHSIELISRTIVSGWMDRDKPVFVDDGEDL